MNSKYQLPVTVTDGQTADYSAEDLALLNYRPFGGMSRRTFIASIGALALTAATKGLAATTSRTDTTVVTVFTHPGLLGAAADFVRMKAKVAASEAPWTAAYAKLINNWHASLNRTPKPTAEVDRTSSGGNYTILAEDIAAAYCCALRWKVTGDEAYADKAVTIFNGWSSTLTTIGGDITNFLVTGIQGYQFACAAEIVRSYSGWLAADFLAFQNMMLNIFYPSVNQGLVQSLTPLTVYSSWQLACVASIMAIGVLCDDSDKFSQAVDFFKSGLQNGALAQVVYFVHPGYLGQTQESGRDQGHNTLSLSLLSVICEMAWNQGVDLYGYRNNRVLAAAEYVARGNLIESGTTYYTMPFTPYNTDFIGDTAFSTSSRGAVRPEWAMIYNHYVNRKGIAAPYTTLFKEKIEPDGGTWDYGDSGGVYDQLGYETLTTTLDAIADGTPPSGLTVNIVAGKPVLSWWGSAYATSYNLKRATVQGGAYTKITTIDSTSLLTFTDTSVTDGTYYYVVTAVTPAGETAISNEAVCRAGLQLHTHLTFDEGTGTVAADASGNGNVGTLNGGASWGTGQSGTALSLDGTDGYVSLPAGALSDVGDMTIAAWVYWKGGAKFQRIFDFGANSMQYLFMTPMTDNGRFSFRMSANGSGTGSQDVVSDSTSLVKNQWVHVAVTLSGSILTLYLNGEVIDTNTEARFAPFRMDDADQLWIGRSQFSADAYFNGLIDELRIYYGAMTAAEVASLYQS